MTDYLEKLASIQALAEDGNLEQAFEECESIINSWPDNAEALHLSAYILILRGLPDKAIDRLLIAISEVPDNYVYYSTLAVAYQSCGDIPNACACYRRILNLQPNDQMALVSLADLTSVRGVKPKVLEDAKRTSTRLVGYYAANSLAYAERALEVDPGNEMAIEMDHMLNAHIKYNVIAHMDAVVPDGIGRGKPKVIYPLRVTSRIGHLIGEPYLLKCLFDPEEYDLIILTPPRDLAVSGPVYDIALAETFPVAREETGPSVPKWEQALTLWGSDCGIRTVDDRTYVLERINDLMGRVMRNVHEGKPLHKFKLNDVQREKGLDLRRKMGIPAEARIVTLYAREKGYFPTLSHHSHRNADIQSYIPAIKFLVEEGFYVIRIGDDKMHRLPDLGPQVIDAPFHPAYTQLVEPYFVSESSFMIKTLSGPDFLSMAFGIPCLLTNFYWCAHSAQIENDLCIPKKYYSHRFQRELTLSEIASEKELLFSGDVKDFTSRHIELIHNSEQEILSATMEMVSRQRGQYEGNPLYDARFQKLCRRLHEDCAKDIYSDSHLNLYGDYFGPYLAKMILSHSYCDLNPEFLW